MPGEGHILFAQAGERGGNFGRIRLSLGEKRNLKEGIGILRNRQGDRVALITQGI